MKNSTSKTGIFLCRIGCRLKVKQLPVEKYCYKLDVRKTTEFIQKSLIMMEIMLILDLLLRNSK
jgi:hypothetical protein